MVRLKLMKVDHSDLPKVLKLLNLLVQRGEDCDKTNVYNDCAKNISPRTNFPKFLVSVTGECLAGHRFKAATQILEILSLFLKKKKHMHSFMLLAGLQVLENTHSSVEEFVDYFIQYFLCWRKKRKEEALREYLIFCLKNNITPGSIYVRNIMSFRKLIGENFYDDPLVDAYLGIFNYIVWVKQVTIHPQSVLALSEAEKAQTLFKKAIRLPGQWDIFVMKLVEIFEFYKKYDEALENLTLYVDTNPNHINGYMYMFNFLHKYAVNREQQLKCLKELLRLSPSDVHVFYLIELLKDDTNGIEKSLRCMFMFLDYPVHRNNLRAWKTLTKLILDVLKDPLPTALNVMSIGWKQRAEFWKRIYFSKWNSRIFSMRDAKVALQKAVFLSAFEENHPFVQTVLAELSKKYGKLYLRLVKKLGFLRCVKENS